MMEQAVYNSENGRWYRLGESLCVRPVVKGAPTIPFSNGVKADTYPEAFELLYGHPIYIPPSIRAPRKSEAS